MVVEQDPEHPLFAIETRICKPLKKGELLLIMLSIRVVFYAVLLLLSIVFVCYGVKTRHIASMTFFLLSFLFVAVAFEWLMDALLAADHLVTVGGFSDSSRWSHQFVTSIACCGLSWLFSVCWTTAGLVFVRRGHHA